MKKILIIKLGYSETLDMETSKIVSLGDVLRCTIILQPLKEKFPNARITWVISKEALPLIKNNKFIDKILVWDEFIPFVLMREKFDMVINLEKINGICALTDMIDSWDKVGFRFNSVTGEFDTYMQSMIAKDYITGKNHKKDIWQKIILEMIGCKWEKQEYSLGYKPKTNVEFDVGFNYHVGKKWPTKAMPKHKWEELEKNLKKENLTITWQEGLDSIYDYIDWINKVKVLVTSDSLGLHIALALKKKIVALFGATSYEEIYFYNRGKAITAKNNIKCNIMPCYSSICKNDVFCMEHIDISEIEKWVLHYLGKFNE